MGPPGFIETCQGSYHLTSRLNEGVLASGTVGLMRHRQTKGAGTARLGLLSHVHYYSTSGPSIAQKRLPEPSSGLVAEFRESPRFILHAQFCSSVCTRNSRDRRNPAPCRRSTCGGAGWRLPPAPVIACTLLSDPAFHRQMTMVEADEEGRELAADDRDAGVVGTRISRRSKRQDSSSDSALRPSPLERGVCRSDCTPVRSIQGRGFHRDGKLAIAEPAPRISLARRATLAGPSRCCFSSS